MKRNQSGFTLIEIAIVLVIIGLLLGGVLKGQELINSAKVKNLATDFRNIPVFIYGYQDKFRAVPGDDQNAATHVTGAQSCGAVGTATATCNPGNGLIEGPWDVMVSPVQMKLNILASCSYGGFGCWPNDGHRRFAAHKFCRWSNRHHQCKFVHQLETQLLPQHKLAGTYVICSCWDIG